MFEQDGFQGRITSLLSASKRSLRQVMRDEKKMQRRRRLHPRRNPAAKPACWLSAEGMLSRFVRSEFNIVRRMISTRWPLVAAQLQ
ncbi:hypothetical protein LAD77_00465 [Klebsiella pneumoniae]|nr:hypothetical protein [Klebsiella pneumoniae]